jgi:hypothetical protein
MRRSLRAFWGTLMWTYFVAGAIDPARAQGVAASPVAPAPSQVTPPALPTLPQAFPEAPPIPNCRNARPRRSPSASRPRRCRFRICWKPVALADTAQDGIAIHGPNADGIALRCLVAVVHHMNGERHQNPELLDKRG